MLEELEYVDFFRLCELVVKRGRLVELLVQVLQMENVAVVVAILLVCYFSVLIILHWDIAR